MGCILKVDCSVITGTMWGDSRRDGERLRSLVPLGLGDDEHSDQMSDRSRSDDGLYGRFREAVTAAAFWVAIPLPFLYVPVLFSGLEKQSEYLAFTALLVAHVAALSLGHPYATNQAQSGS